MSETARPMPEQLPAIWTEQASSIDRSLGIVGVYESPLSRVLRSCARDLQDALDRPTASGGYREGTHGAVYDQDYDPETGR